MLKFSISAHGDCSAVEVLAAQAGQLGITASGSGNCRAAMEKRLPLLSANPELNKWKTDTVSLLHTSATTAACGGTGQVHRQVNKHNKVCVHLCHSISFFTTCLFMIE